ncbi:YncE family protein [Streptomyces sioyaensis]|uniref:YncE family protein n=1 Tax=Streptomyces sioyaensis TaxID=67364 RepID=UPI00379C78EC
MIDTTTDTVIVPGIPVGTQPLSVTVAPNGNAYVVNRNSNNVTVIDTATNSVVGAPIPVGHNPVSVAVAPNGKIYVANFASLGQRHPESPHPDQSAAVTVARTGAGRPDLREPVDVPSVPRQDVQRRPLLRHGSVPGGPVDPQRHQRLPGRRARRRGCGTHQTTSAGCGWRSYAA